VAGGEYGISGFVRGLTDPASGKRLWRFYTIPGPRRIRHDTWEGDSWKEGSGATLAQPAPFVPELNTLFWPVGQSGPDINGEVRKGDNLFTCAVLALDPDTGRPQVHYQFTPNDTTTGIPPKTMVLVDRCQGPESQAHPHADRNGVFTSSTARTESLLSATPYGPHQLG